MTIVILGYGTSAYYIVTVYCVCVCVCACVCVYSGTEAAAAEEPAEAVCDGVRLKPTASAEECEGSGRQRGRQAR